MNKQNHASISNWFYLTLVIPITFAILALLHFGFFFKCGTAGAGILILIFLYFRTIPPSKDIFMLIAAFAFSIIGDWLLSNKHGDANMFVYGIAFYFLAHLGYLIYALMNGKIKWSYTIFISVLFLVFFTLVLIPSIDNNILLGAVLIYLLISCISLGAALGIVGDKTAKLAFVFGIFLILFSDTIISLNEFAGYKNLNFLILPTYYLAHISIIFVLIRKSINSPATSVH